MNSTDTENNGKTRERIEHCSHARPRVSVQRRGDLSLEAGRGLDNKEETTV